MGKIDQAKEKAKILIDIRNELEEKNAQLGPKLTRFDFPTRQKWNEYLREYQLREQEIKELESTEKTLVEKILDLLNDYKDTPIFLFHNRNQYRMIASTKRVSIDRQDDGVVLLLTKVRVTLTKPDS